MLGWHAPVRPMAERASGRAERDGLARSAILPNPTGRYKDKTDDRRTRTREERRERRRFLSPRCSSGPPSAASRSSAQLERPRSTSCSAPEHRTDAHQASCRPPGARWTPIMSAGSFSRSLLRPSALLFILFVKHRSPRLSPAKG